MHLFLLPSMLSICRPTNEEIVETDFEDFLSFSRNEPLHPLLDVLAENDEKDELLSSTLRTQRDNVSLVQYQSNAFLSIGMILDEESAGSFLCGLAFAFGCVKKHSTKRKDRTFHRKNDTVYDAPLHSDQHGTSWRSDVPPPCLGGPSHGWVPVNTRADFGLEAVGGSTTTIRTRRRHTNVRHDE